MNEFPAFVHLGEQDCAMIWRIGLICATPDLANVLHLYEQGARPGHRPRQQCDGRGTERRLEGFGGPGRPGQGRPRRIAYLAYKLLPHKKHKGVHRKAVVKHKADTVSAQQS
jgi:hypothetical protein